MPMATRMSRCSTRSASRIRSTRRRSWPATPRSGWDVVRFQTKRSQFHPMALARTTALFGGFAAAVGAGAVVGVLTNDSRGGVDLATSLFGRLAGQLGNIRIRRHRRATHDAPSRGVLHQSSEHADRRARHLQVVQRGFTVVAKAEVKQIPVLGPLLTLADVAFVDRSNTSKAISAMQPAVDRLRAGISIAISPEGTRSLSPQSRGVQEGRLSPGPRRGSSDRSDRHPQCRRNHVAQRESGPGRHASKSLSTNRFRLPAGPRPISMSGCRECASSMSIPSMIGRASMPANSGRRRSRRHP